MTSQLIAEVTREYERLQRNITRAERNPDTTDADIDALYREGYGIVARAMDNQYSVEEIERWCKRAKELGAPHPKFGVKRLEQLARIEVVPNEPFRGPLEVIAAESEESLLKVTDFFRLRLESMEQRWHMNFGAAQFRNEAAAQRLKYVAGVIPRREVKNGKTYVWAEIFIDYRQAVALADVLGMTPIQAGV